MKPEYDRLIDHVVQALQSTTSPQQAHRITHFISDDATFRDPHMDTRGKEGMRAAMTALFDGAKNGTIRISDRAWGMDDQTVYLRWDRLLNLHDGRRHVYSGVSEIMIGMDGKIASIIDHWDGANTPQVAQVSLLRRILKR